jgi:predicted dehydrogenase
MVKKWQELSVLIAGCGSIGKRHARVLHGLGVTDLRVCDPVLLQLESLQEQVPSVRMYDSYETALADRPDAVVICTPTAQHVAMATQAINAGCHVLCEKPLADMTAGIDELSALATSQKKKCMVAYCYRYHAGLGKAKHYLDTGRVGRLVSIRCLMGEYLPAIRLDYRDLYLAKRGGALELIHAIDLAIWYAAHPMREILALSRNYSDIGIEAPDFVEILIDFEGRCMASVHLDFFQRPRRCEIELICTEGEMVVDFSRWDRCTVGVFEAAKGEWEREELVTERDNMFRAEDKEFLQAVAEDGPIRCTIAEARKSVEVIQAALG